MVIVLPAREKVNPWARAFEGFGEGISQAMANKQQREAEDRAFARQNKQRFMQNLEAKENEFQRQKQLGGALQQLEGIYSNPELTDQQKMIGAYRTLSSHPDLAKQLTGQLGALSEAQQEQNFFDQLMGGGRPTEKETAPQFDFGEDEEETPRRRRGFDAGQLTDKQIDQLRAIKSKSPKAQTIANLAQQEYERRQEGKQAKTKYLENLAPFESALEALDRMKELGKGGNLGIGSKVYGVISPKTRRDRAEYERLGKSLIQYSTNIPIRNRQEFEVLAHDLYDPSISDASREGILSAMRQIIENSMRQFEAPPERNGKLTEMGEVNLPTQSGSERKQERKPLNSFLR